MHTLPSGLTRPATTRAELERRLAQGEPGGVPPAELHYLLWECCHACRDPDAAAAHLAAAIAIDPLRSRPAPAGGAPDRVVLALAAPGDLQANLPLALLLDGGATELHTLHLDDPEALRRAPGRIRDRLARLDRPVDLAVVTIAEDDRARARLEAADAVAQALGLPLLNRGAAIASMSRILVSRRLAGIEGFVVPLHSAATAAAVASRGVVAPFIVRPVGSHAGRALARIASRQEARAYLDAHPGEDRFTVAPFVDTRSPDGLYRKLRIVFVAGVPYPLHLAIGEDWAVWYFNAGMAAHPDRQAEEDRFLQDMRAYLGAAAMAALERLGRRVELDLFGLDAGLLPDGRLVVFEIETGMIVTDVGRPPDRPQPASAIRVALEAAIDRAIRAHRDPPPPMPVAPRRGRPVRMPAFPPMAPARPAPVATVTPAP